MSIRPNRNSWKYVDPSDAAIGRGEADYFGPADSPVILLRPDGRQVEIDPEDARRLPPASHSGHDGTPVHLTDDGGDVPP